MNSEERNKLFEGVCNAIEIGHLYFEYKDRLYPTLIDKLVGHENYYELDCKKINCGQCALNVRVNDKCHGHGIGDTNKEQAKLELAKKYYDLIVEGGK